MRNPRPEPLHQPAKEPSRPSPLDAASSQDPLFHLIRSIEQVREACFVCDRVPLEEMIIDLRRWSAQLAPEEIEVPTVRQGQGLKASSKAPAGQKK